MPDAIIGRERELFCNRTLNMRSIRAVGYDMDYTLVHYHVEEWERTAYEHIKQHLADKGWPVAGLQYDPDAIIRGLIIDTELGNVVKANRFGFIKKALHGTKAIDFEEQRRLYARTIVDLAEPRWQFLNTFFSMSEAWLYCQLVDLLDARQLPGVMGYSDLYKVVRKTVDRAHMEGKLKAEILARPEKFIVPDEETPLALLDQKNAGKKLLLITNSEWTYTRPLMSYAFDRYLPKGQTWRDLFDVIIIGARKPEFFLSRSPLFEIATEEGLLRPSIGPLTPGNVYLGGSAAQVEEYLGVAGEEILYVGDHVFGDVHVTKNILRWRTALIMRELEEELQSIERFAPTEQRLADLMDRKEALERQNVQARLALQRHKARYGPKPNESENALQQKLAELRTKMTELDEQIAPLAKAASELHNPTWGLAMRAGNDKSHLARQVERHADVYTSRVSNFLLATPFVYLRSLRGSLPHDPSLPGGRPANPLESGS